MDLEEWEFVADDGFLEFHDDGGGKKIFSGKYGMGRATSSPRNVFNVDYFRCPSPKSPQFVDSTTEEESVVLPRKQLIPLSVQLDDPVVMDHPDVVARELTTNIPVVMDYPDVVARELTTTIPVVIPATAASSIEAAETGAWEAEQDPVFQVFFKKMKENEFVDMKMDSPKSGSREFFHQIEAGTFQFEEKSDQTWNDEAAEGRKINNNSSPTKVKADDQKEEETISWEESNEEGMNLWKRVGTICSFGMAAATICIIIFGNNGQKNKHNQKLRFQIYSDDKRIKQVVEQATKLNEAISSAVRGVPLTRAHITSGGYYDGL